MPRAAIATGTIDWVLPSRTFPASWFRCGAMRAHIELPASEDEEAALAPRHRTPQAAKLAETRCRDILLTLRARTGHDFRNYKRATDLRGSSAGCRSWACPTCRAYRAFLQAQPEEAHALLKDLLIGVTNFFRDSDAFEMLQREAIARICRGRDVPAQAFVPGWPDAPPAREAYSLAMLAVRRG
jgi:two-component system CheB/CheR fusion protein